MVRWSANDDPTGKPSWSNTADVYGVDATEAQVKGKSVAPGWVRVITGTGEASLTLVSGGTGYTNADYITVDGVTTSGVVNATSNVLVDIGANLTGTVAVTSGQANVVGTGTALSTNFANGDSLFVYSNATNYAVAKINQVVNATFMNITSTWSVTNSTAKFGVSGIIQTIVTPVGGSGFTTQTNVAITTTNGKSANVTATPIGRAGRVSYENMVIVRRMSNDASDDTTFADS